MKNIRSHKDAREVAEKFVAEMLEIQLWDAATANRIMCYMQKDEDRNTVKVAFVDTVNGTESFSDMSISEIEGTIWNYRKYINRSGQLAHI